MTQDAKIREGDASALERIITILTSRSQQYSSAVVRGVYIKEKEDEWRNGITKIIALAEPREEHDESLDYGSVLYMEETLSLEKLRRIVDRLVNSGVLQIGCQEIRVVREEDIGKGNFIREEFVSTLHRDIKAEWPANFYEFRGSSVYQRGLPNDGLVALDKPSYPDTHHLVADKVGMDLQFYNAWLGSVLLLLPNYQAKISDIKVGTTSMSLVVTPRFTNLSDLLAKVFATNGETL